MAHETRPGDGREKSDAALLAEFAQLLAEAETGIDNTAAGMALMEVIGDRGREYLSGTRPLPTDEVAALSARVGELEALGRVSSAIIFDVFNRGLSADCVENQAVAQNLIEAWGALLPPAKPTPGAEGGDK